MVYLADVTEGMNLEMIDNFLHPLNYSNLELCAVVKESSQSVLFGRFWKSEKVLTGALRKGESIEVETSLIVNSHLLYSQMKKVIGESEKVYYLLISKDVVRIINSTSHEYPVFDYEAKRLIPLRSSQLKSII